MADAYPDAALVADFNMGRKQAFDELFDRYYERLMTFVSGIIRDRENAKDIIQETFIALSRKRADFDKLSDIHSFLYVAARNRCIDYMRVRKRITEREQRFINAANDADELNNDLLDGDFLQALHASVENLPQRSREVIVLYYMQELKYREIAEKLNISDRTVENLLSQALKKLRKSLAEKMVTAIWFLFL